MKKSETVKNQAWIRLPAIIAAVLFVVIFGLYYLGVYDISFIDRPSSWDKNFDMLMAAFHPESPDTDAADTTSGEEETPAQTAPPTQSTGVHGTLPEGYSAAPTFSSVSELLDSGWSRTDKVYDSSCVFGILSPEYSWPTALSYSEKTVDTEKISTYEDGTESTVETVRDTAQRLALEMYMGYIIYDDRGTQYLIGPDGTVLREYDDTSFIPAYTRDSVGHPLFYRPSSVSVDYPTETGEPNENGNSDWISKNSFSVSKKIYYYLNGNSDFVEANYNDAIENRGLYFDYPSYYGVSGSGLTRYCRNTTKIFTDLDGKTSLLHSMNWLYSSTNVDLSALSFNPDGTNKEEGGKSLEEMFPFTYAYNYSGDYAVVQKDIKWDYTHEKENEDGSKEDETVDVTSAELRVVDKSGNVKFDSRKNYYSELGWTANERFVAPLSKGISSIGSYYFDHGLLRLRIQSYDRFYFTDLDSVKIVTDDDVLVYPDGTKFNIPGGYRLVYYSDGVLCLEKEGKYGYMNTEGVWISGTDLTYAGAFLEGVAACCNAQGNYGVIDTSGNTVIPFKYSYISNISSGTLTAYSSASGWTVYQKLTNG